MTNKRIPDLTAATTPLAGTELVPVWNGTSTKKVTVAKILTPAAGNGIDYSANTPAAGMTSQLLNWYEEGTWTVTRTGFVEVLGTGSITNTGRYTRVGRVVTVNITMVCAGGATLAAGTGGVASVNLPSTAGIVSSGIWVNYSTLATSGNVFVQVNGNLYIVTSWIAASASWVIEATYTI